MQCERSLLAAEQSEVEVGSHGRLQLQCQSCLCRVVASPCVIQKTHAQLRGATGEQSQMTTAHGHLPLAQQRVGKGVSAPYLAPIARAVVGSGDAALVQQLVHEAGGVLFAARVRQEAQVGAAVFLRREVGVEDVGVADAKHKSILPQGVLLQGVQLSQLHRRICI